MMRPIHTLVFFCAGLLICASAALREPSAYVVGDKVEDFTLPNVDGQPVSLATFPATKGYIIVFTCNHCPYAQLYEQRIIDLHRKFGPKGFPVIAINPNDPTIVPDDSFDEMKKRSDEMKYPFVYLFDSAQTVFPRFGAQRTPHAYVLDQDRVVRYIGAIDDNAETPGEVKRRYVEDAVTALLRGERPATNFTRAIGCPIKRRKQ